MAVLKYVDIMNNDGSTGLFSFEATNEDVTLSVSSDGVEDSRGNIWKYDGDKKFAGLTNTVNSSDVDYSIGESYVFPNDDSTTTIYIVEAEQPLIDLGGLKHYNDKVGEKLTELKETITEKQDKLIAGENITIAADGKTISATGGSGAYTVTKLANIVLEEDATVFEFNCPSNVSRVMVSIVLPTAAPQTRFKFFITTGWFRGAYEVASLVKGDATRNIFVDVDVLRKTAFLNSDNRTNWGGDYTTVAARMAGVTKMMQNSSGRLSSDAFFDATEISKFTITWKDYSANNVLLSGTEIIVWGCVS